MKKYLPSDEICSLEFSRLFISLFDKEEMSMEMLLPSKDLLFVAELFAGKVFSQKFKINISDLISNLLHHGFSIGRMEESHEDFITNAYFSHKTQAVFNRIIKEHTKKKIPINELPFRTMF
jgi:hypothetical protein